MFGTCYGGQNRSLKEIGIACGIEAPLTSYVARHSYATIAKYKGVPTAIISEALRAFLRGCNPSLPRLI